MLRLFLRARSSLLILALTLGLVSLACPFSPLPQVRTLEVEVVGISDGDSLRILLDGEAQPLRLAGIDCPERGQPFGDKARQGTASMAHGRKVQITITDRDRYGRAVGSVLLPDGKELNAELLRLGLAWWYRSFAPERRDYQRLEKEARKARRGLWSEKNPSPPWEWRKERPPQSRR